jgi:hypothetical protein
MQGETTASRRLSLTQLSNKNQQALPVAVTVTPSNPCPYQFNVLRCHSFASKTSSTDKVEHELVDGGVEFQFVRWQRRRRNEIYANGAGGLCSKSGPSAFVRNALYPWISDKFFILKQQLSVNLKILDSDQVHQEQGSIIWNLISDETFSDELIKNK